MVRVEEKLGNLSHDVKRLDDAVLRIHERIDEMDQKMQSVIDGVHARVSAAIVQMEAALEDHVSDEEKLTLARFDTIKQLIETVQQAGEMRQKATGAVLQRLENIVVWAAVGIAGAGASVVGFIATFVVKNHESINVLLTKLETLK